MTDAVAIQKIVDSTSTVFHFDVSELKGRKRKKRLALARQVAMYIIRQETDCALVVIGKELGERTPATVSWGYQQVAKSLCSKPQLRVKVAAIKKMVYEEV